MDPLRFEQEAPYALTPEELWAFVADTQRLNRSIGLPDAHFKYEARVEGGSQVTGEYRRAGILISRWREHPFSFVRHQRYSVLREYDVGPFVSVHGGAELIPDDGGTRLRVWADITPRHVLGWLAAKLLVGPQSTGRVIDRCRRYEREIAARREKGESEAVPIEAQMSVFSGPPPDVNTDRLDQLISRLVSAGGDPGISKLLRQHLATAPDDNVASMRAFELADLWGTDRRETLATFLWATTVGLLELRWEILCPYCRVPKAAFATLAQMTGEAHCESCSITFDANFDRLVEVRFKPAVAVREAIVGVYCIGGPHNQPHVVAQTELRAGELVDWDLNLEGGEYRLRSPQARGAALIEVEPAGPPANGEAGAQPKGQVQDDGVELAVAAERIAPPLLQVSGERVRLKLQSRLDAPGVLVLEEQSWADTATTAALVSTMAEFRDLFSSEVLAPGLQVAIERLALLFTDLSGSTALYERIGQARAFRLVQDHFTVLDPPIREHNGTIVKTIGDAVMAAFPSAKEAAAAALDMQCRIRQMAIGEEVDPAHFLKVAIHAGACVAVTLNDKLDYFGTAVNIAARAEHEAQGGQIMVTADAWRDPGVEELLTARAGQVQTSEAVLRGITAPVQLYRVTEILCEPAAASDSESTG